jgi:hypothetical protein
MVGAETGRLTGIKSLTIRPNRLHPQIANMSIADDDSITLGSEDTVGDISDEETISDVSDDDSVTLGDDDTDDDFEDEYVMAWEDIRREEEWRKFYAKRRREDAPPSPSPKRIR